MDSKTTIQNLKDAVRDMCLYRGWGGEKAIQNPQRMAMAMTIELGELMEHFAWLDNTQLEDLAAGIMPGRRAHIAEELADILYDWKSKVAGGGQYPRKQGPLAGKMRKRYTPEFKSEVIASYQSHGSAATREKYGISSNALYTWLEEAGIERNRNRPIDHTDAIAMYREKGQEAVLEAYGITWPTLREWLKDAGIDTHPPKYNPELVEKALVMAQENTLTAVAKELDIPIATLSAWKLGKRRKG